MTRRDSDTYGRRDGSSGGVESPSTLGEPIRSIVEDPGEHASARSVYGDPLEADGKTVVPVARVGCGFGGGFGRSGVDVGEGGIGGGGGGVSAKPVGVVEVDEGETRFVRFGERRRAGLALLAGIVPGILLGRRR